MSDPKSVALEFFELFGDFEFALKRAGILMKKRNAEADWVAYSRMLGSSFFEDVLDRKIAPNLIAEPPRKLVADGLEWLPKAPVPIGDVTGLMVQGVCGVRNNYAHGEKFKGGDPDWSRDAALIADALAVLRSAIGRVSEVDRHL